MGLILSVTFAAGCPATATIAGDDDFGGIQSADLIELFDADSSRWVYSFATVSDFCGRVTEEVNALNLAATVLDDVLNAIDAPNSEGGRRAWCEAQRNYWSARAQSNSDLIGEGGTMGVIRLRRPLDSGGTTTEPAAGTYRKGSDIGADEATFSASFLRYEGNPYGPYVDREIDCDAYATSADDPYASALPFAPTTDESYESIDSRSITAGRLTVASTSDTTWDLTLTEGDLRDESNRLLGSFELSGSFSDCPVELPEGWSDSLLF